MGGLLLKFRTWWETADRTQRAVTIFGGLFLVLLLGGTYIFASKPKMEMAFAGLSTADVGIVTQEIQKMGVPVDFDLQGNVSVPSDKVADVRAKLASAGKLPAGGHMLSDELSKLNMMETPTVEREKLKGILEGQLAQSIEAIQGVSSARVHLTLATQSATVNDSQPASASIFVTETAGSIIGSDQGRAIATLVANAVTGMKLENVFVLNNQGQSVFDGRDASGSGRATQKLDAEIAESTRRERELQATLDQSFGRGATLVKVNMELDFDESSVQSNKPEVGESPISQETSKETLGSGGTKTGGVAGAPGGAPVGSSPSKDGGYVADQSHKNFPQGFTNTDTKKAVGTIKSMSIAVLADQSKNIEAKSVEDFLKGYLGPKAADANYKVTVTTVKFDDTAAKTAKDTATSAASAARMQQIFSLLPVGALILVAFMVIKSVAKTAKSAGNVLVGALPGGQMMPVGTLTASTASSDYSPSGSTSDGAVQIGDDGQPLPRPKKKKKINPDDDDEEDEDVGKIRQRLNKPLEQIKKLTTERPETVAMLIKSWLVEERR